MISFKVVHVHIQLKMFTSFPFNIPHYKAEYYLRNENCNFKFSSLLKFGSAGSLPAIATADLLSAVFEYNNVVY
jgi:hypothetical protein